jgi:hypothetical protein
MNPYHTNVSPGLHLSPAVMNESCHGARRVRGDHHHRPAPEREAVERPLPLAILVRWLRAAAPPDQLRAALNGSTLYWGAHTGTERCGSA